MTLSQILNLVGDLNDSSEKNPARDRFRQFLKENVVGVAQVRDFVQGCLQTSGPQYNRALQDLINHLGTLLGFQVEFGRYQGVHGEIGFDGHWISPCATNLFTDIFSRQIG